MSLRTLPEQSRFQTGLDGENDIGRPPWMRGRKKDCVADSLTPRHRRSNIRASASERPDWHSRR